MISVRIIHRQDQSSALKIACAEQEVFKACIAALKQTIPQPLRRFDFVTRHWVISPGAAEHLDAYISWAQATHCAEIEQSIETEMESRVREQEEQERQQTPQDKQAKRAGTGGRRGRHNGLHLARCMNLESAYNLLYLRPGAPPEVIQAAYRALAKMHHPDVGGNNDVMAEINDAYAFLSNAFKDEHAA